MTAAASIANKGLDIAGQMATQRVIGYSKTKTRINKKGSTVTNENVAISAWEILFGAALLLGGIAAYDFVEGPGSLGNTLQLTPSKLQTFPVASGVSAFNPGPVMNL